MIRRLRTAAFLCIAAGIVACSKSSTGVPPGFECLGLALPTTAPALVNVSGRVTANVLSPSPVPHAFVYAFRVGDTTHFAGDTTDTPGNYSLAISTGGSPVNGYLTVSDSGRHLSTSAYPAVPLASDVTENVLLVSSSEFALLAGSAGITPVAGDGFIAIVVRNCQGEPVAGATVSSTPAGEVRYNVGSIPNATATSTSSDGVGYIANVAPGDVTVKASISGLTLRQHVVRANADGITLTEIQP
jgi:hypothetical protein